MNLDTFSGIPIPNITTFILFPFFLNGGMADIIPNCLSVFDKFKQKNDRLVFLTSSRNPCLYNAIIYVQNVLTR